MTQAGPEQLPRLVNGMQLAAGHVNDFMQQMQVLSGVLKADVDWLSKLQVVTADALLAPLITECLPLAHWQRVSLRYRKNQSILQVNVPAVQRMLRNLINNALTYTPAGGRVLIGCRSRAGLLWIFCLDNGKGMSPEQLKQCTKAYRRFESNAGGFDHLGLGLYSVKKMAEQMRLPLRLQSTQGKGSMMGFAVPLLQAKAAVGART
jgi:signal transduction histidine kinase